MSPLKTITLAFTGASGMPLGLRLLEQLLQQGLTVYLVYTPAAQIVAKQETDLILPGRPQDAWQQLTQRYGALTKNLHVFGQQDWLAPIASGSGVADAMVVCPCTMGTLAAMATGLSENLLERAADVTLKERRPLIIVPRETPLSTIHLENMLRLARAGAVMLPPVPGFYQQPQTIQDLLDFLVAKILDQLRIPHQLLPRWGEERVSERTEQ